jgi:ABC-type multidrug transport system fused ATPase/permease subunit
VVAASWVEKYAKHAVWEQIKDSRYALKQAGKQDHDGAELARLQLVAALERVERAKGTLSPFVTTSDMDNIQNHLSNYLPVTGVTGYLAQPSIVDTILVLLRALANPTPAVTTKQATEAVAELTSIRETEIATLEKRLAGLRQRVEATESAVESVKTTVGNEQRTITGQTERLTQAVEGAADKFETELAKLSQKWELEQSSEIRKFGEEAESEVQVLAKTALLGKKLVQHAAGQSTAASWGARSKRDLRAANYLFGLGVIVFIVAGALAYYFVWEVTKNGGTSGLSVGESILRISIVLTLGGGIAYLFAESGRRRREGNSAEEVETVLSSMDAFLATSDDGARTTLMESVGATIFVDNIRSRLSARDAVRGQDGSPLDIDEAVRIAADLVKKSASNKPSDAN